MSYLGATLPCNHFRVWHRSRVSKPWVAKFFRFRVWGTRYLKVSCHDLHILGCVVPWCHGTVASEFFGVLVLKFQTGCLGLCQFFFLANRPHPAIFGPISCSTTSSKRSFDHILAIAKGMIPRMCSKTEAPGNLMWLIQDDLVVVLLFFYASEACVEPFWFIFVLYEFCLKQAVCKHVYKLVDINKYFGQISAWNIFLDNLVDCSYCRLQLALVKKGRYN